jgi:hypothetical protein
MTPRSRLLIADESEEMRYVLRKIAHAEPARIRAHDCSQGYATQK